MIQTTTPIVNTPIVNNPLVKPQVSLKINTSALNNIEAIIVELNQKILNFQKISTSFSLKDQGEFDSIKNSIKLLTETYRLVKNPTPVINYTGDAK